MTNLQKHGKRLGLPNLGVVAPKFEFFGFVDNGAVYCQDCANVKDDLLDYIPSQEESDSPVHCDACGILFPTSLTSDGVDYIHSVDGRSSTGKLFRAAFPWAF